MDLEELKKLLGDDELAQKVHDKLNGTKLMVDTGSLLDSSSTEFAKSYMPRSVYNEERKKLQAQLEERNSDLEQIREKAKGGEALKSEIDELKKKYDTRDKEAIAALDTERRKHAIHLALIAEGCNAPELVATQIDPSKLIEVNGEFSGMKELIEPMKERYKPNFTKIVPKGESSPNDPNGGSPGDDETTFKGKKKKDLTLMDQMELKRSKPDLYAKWYPKSRDTIT